MVSSTTLQHPKVEHVTVLPEVSGQRLDNFLICYLKGVPKTCIYRIIRRGEVRVNKGRAKPEYRLNEGDIVRIPPLRKSEKVETKDLSASKAGRQAGQQIEANIIYEDESLLVLNKPAGLACHGGSGLSFGAIELMRQLRPKVERLELVHRLDRETSGCLLIAKNRKILKRIHEQLVKGEVEKIYLAMVKGSWKGGKTVDAPLLKNHLQSGERMVKVHPKGQKACTEFTVLEKYAGTTANATAGVTANAMEGTANTTVGTTLMEAKLVTGRTHQIRVHAAHVGNPIVGDPKYGEQHFNREMKLQGLNRMFLHAKQITLKINEKTGPITFVAPLDAELESFLRELQK